MAKYFYCIGSSWDTTQAKLEYTHQRCFKVNVSQNIRCYLISVLLAKAILHQKLTRKATSA